MLSFEFFSDADQSDFIDWLENHEIDYVVAGYVVSVDTDSADIIEVAESEFNGLECRPPHKISIKRR